MSQENTLSVNNNDALRNIFIDISKQENLSGDSYKEFIDNLYYALRSKVIDPYEEITDLNNKTVIAVILEAAQSVQNGFQFDNQTIFNLSQCLKSKSLLNYEITIILSNGISGNLDDDRLYWFLSRCQEKQFPADKIQMVVDAFEGPISTATLSWFDAFSSGKCAANFLGNLTNNEIILSKSTDKHDVISFLNLFNGNLPLKFFRNYIAVVGCLFNYKAEDFEEDVQVMIKVLPSEAKSAKKFLDECLEEFELQNLLNAVDEDLREISAPDTFLEERSDFVPTPKFDRKLINKEKGVGSAQVVGGGAVTGGSIATFVFASTIAAAIGISVLWPVYLVAGVCSAGGLLLMAF